MLSFNTGVAAATALYKRATESHMSLHGRDEAATNNPNQDPRLLVLILANWIIFLPALLLAFYTFEHVYPTLAVVEDENHSIYESVPLSDDADANGGPEPARKPVGSVPALDTSSDAPPASAVTSSFRSISRLLRADGGFRAYYRGLSCAFAQFMATVAMFSVFAAVMPTALASIGVLAASLALVQLSTVWVHIVITRGTALPFWQRLPPFGRTFKATAYPTVLYWLALQISHFVPLLLVWALGMDKQNETSGFPIALPTINFRNILIILVGFVLSIFLVIPAHVVLVRVQASLLPDPEHTIVHLDRSFGGTVIPVVAGGRGYATMGEAWRTFSNSAWRRLVILYVKVYFAAAAILIILGAIVALEVVVLSAASSH